MGSWIRARFDGIGLTQSPPGPHLKALQARFGGTVLLCIDVSGSMSGEPLRQAVAGGQRFLAEAHGAHYRCGLVLWSDTVNVFLDPDTPPEQVTARLAAARICGGTDIVATLRLGLRVLGPTAGDRVLCVFGDGDLGDRKTAIALARELCAMGIRIIVRGLGPGATEALSALTCPGERDDRQLIENVDGIAAGIASMAAGLTAGRHSRG